MRTNKLLKLILVVVIAAINYQIISAQEQDPILIKLDSQKFSDRLEASMMIDEGKLTQYSTALEERIFLQNDPYLIYSFLGSLKTINSPNLYGIAKHFIDTIDYYAEVDMDFDRLEAKVFSTGILFNFNDYSTTNYVFEIIERDKPQKIAGGVIVLLDELLYKPEFENRAREELLFILNNDLLKSNEDNYDNGGRLSSLRSLKIKYGLGIKDILIDSFLNDPYFSIQVSAMYYLLELNYVGIDTVLIDKLYSNPLEALSTEIYLIIRKNVDTPAELTTYKTYKPSIQNEKWEKGIKNFVESYIPKNPSSDLTILQMLEKVTNITDELVLYTWLGDLTFSNELKSTLTSAKTSLLAGDSLACRMQVKAFQNLVDNVYKDSLNPDSRFVTIEGWKFLYWNAQYILDRLPEPPLETEISTYSLFATHSVWLEQNSDVLAGNIGVNDVGSPPFLDSQVELSIGIGTSTTANSAIKANRIKVKQGATVHGNVYYNELENNGTITGTLNTPLTLPLIMSIPEFKSATPGTQNINIPQNGEYTLQPGSYNDIDVKKNGRLNFTGGEYHINNITLGDNNNVMFQSSSEIRMAGKFDSGQGSYIGPQDTTSISAEDIVFYVGGINGSNGNLGATPKAAKIGIGNTVKANFYVPNGTLWIRQNSEAEGAFIGKDVDVGIGVKVKLNSAF